MKKTLYLFISFSFIFISNIVSQPIVKKAVGFGETIALRDIVGISPFRIKDSLKIVPNKFNFRKIDENKINGTLLERDPIVQESFGTNTVQASVNANWDGVGNVNGVLPPDVQGDVGPNHYVQVVNLSFQIFDKSGNSLYGPFDLSTIWDGFVGDWTGTNDGDPIVLYDQEADRWMISQFSLPFSQGPRLIPPYFELVAVSKTGDPTGEWYQYAFQFDDYMPDYPHLGIWPDGYYMATNGFNQGISFASAGATCFERDKMLVGDPNARMVYFPVANETNGSEAASMLPSDWDGTQAPPLNSPNYFTYFEDDSEAGVTDDRLRLWEFDVDWITPSNSTFTLVNTLNTAAFDSFLGGDGRSVIPQPETTQGLDDLADRLMFRLQYRNFGTHETLVTNHTVDADGSDHAGIRWYELRNTGSGWSIFQQGTYAPDSDHRWMGSIAMNGNGDIGIEYTVSSNTTFPSIRYSGRLKDDPLGTMTIPEGTIIAGGGSQTHTAARWGDYSMMSVDPVDDATFWATNEYVETTGSAPWKTRIASISFVSPSVLADVKVMIEGAYAGSSNMNTTLLTNNFIPTTSPYADARIVSSIPANVVDWVLVELRKTNDGVAEVSRSAFLSTDGAIVDDDGISKISLDVSADDYFIVIKHRNHIPIMSAAVVTLPNPTTYDFTTGSEKYWGTDGAKQLE